MSNIAPLNQESGLFHPPVHFMEHAMISGMEGYRALCAEAEEDYERFWSRHARDNISWHKPFTQTLNQDHAPFYRWFEDGELNVSYNSSPYTEVVPCPQRRHGACGRGNFEVRGC